MQPIDSQRVWIRSSRPGAVPKHVKSIDPTMDLPKFSCVCVFFFFFFFFFPGGRGGEEGKGGRGGPR